MIVYTAEYLATAAKATIAVTYPDGATFERSVLADGALAGDVRAATARPDGRLSAELDRLRAAHADAFQRSGGKRALSAWAVSK